MTFRLMMGFEWDSNVGGNRETKVYIWISFKSKRNQLRSWNWFYLKFIPWYCAAFITRHGADLHPDRWNRSTILSNQLDHCQPECGHWNEVTSPPCACLGWFRRWRHVCFVVKLFTHFTRHFNRICSSCRAVRIEWIQPKRMRKKQIPVIQKS